MTHHLNQYFIIVNNMKIYYFLGALILLASCSTPKIEQPNFLFILVDDQPFDAMGFKGRYPFLETPNMDKLAKQGANFNNYFCTQSICSPSRASFLTGTYSHIHGVNQNHHLVDPDWESYKPYSIHLQNAGYETAMIGKIHMAHFNGKKHIRPGFDYWYSFKGQGKYFNPEINDNGIEKQVKGYMTDILTNEAVSWLTDKRDTNKPFSLCLWHKAVHEDHLPAPRHENLYENDTLPYPPYNTHKETFEGKPEWQRIKAFDTQWKDYKSVDKLPEKPWGSKSDKYMRLLKTLAAVDESIGTVLETLEQTGELENTVVIFSSDNGYFMGEHTYWDKRIAYENSIRIPMIMRFPEKIKAGIQINEMCLNIDLAPTILELANIEKPAYMQGESMVKLFGNEEASEWRESILFEYYVDDAYPYAGPDMLAVKTDNYKLIDVFLENDIDELYDLQNDPGEMNNLINNPEFDEIEKELRDEMEILKKKYKYNPDRDWWLREVKK